MAAFGRPDGGKKARLKVVALYTYHPQNDRPLVVQPKGGGAHQKETWKVSVSDTILRFCAH
jgi:hypothetical protein